MQVEAEDFLQISTRLCMQYRACQTLTYANSPSLLELQRAAVSPWRVCLFLEAGEEPLLSSVFFFNQNSIFSVQFFLYNIFYNFYVLYILGIRGSTCIRIISELL